MQRAKSSQGMSRGEHVCGRQEGVGLRYEGWRTVTHAGWSGTRPGSAWVGLGAAQCEGEFGGWKAVSWGNTWSREAHLLKHIF